MSAHKLLNSLVHYYTAEVHYKKSFRWFCIAVYLWLFIHALSLIPVHHLLWGREKIFYIHGYSDSLIENFFYQLVYESRRGPYFLVTHIGTSFLSAITFLIGVPASYSALRKTMTTGLFITVRLVAWMSGLMLFYGAIEAFNGAMLLMLLMSSYIVLSFPNTSNTASKAITNASRIACIAQVIVVYLCAALYKLGGQQWIDGTALYYTLHIEHYSSVWGLSFANSHHTLLQIATWAGLVYQVGFPLLIWWKKIRTPLLIVGVVFHLAIGFALGLWDFATAMLVCYVLFIHKEKSAAPSHNKMKIARA